MSFWCCKTFPCQENLQYYSHQQEQWFWLGIIIVISFRLRSLCPLKSWKLQCNSIFYIHGNVKKPTSSMCGCLLPCTCVESARVLHVQTRSREEAEKRKAESQDLRAHRKTAVWSQTHSAWPPHTADELCPYCSPLPAPLLNVIHLLWVWCLTLKVTTLFSTQGTLKGSIYIRLMTSGLFLFA